MDKCFITGGNTNSAFGIYLVDNNDWSKVTKLEIDSPEPAIFLLSIAMEDTTHGVAGGVEIGLGGLYYTTDGKKFTESF